MTEQENIKVYELAKELGIESPLSLVDKLNGLGIKVKSHMSEISPEDLLKAREALSPRSPAAKSGGAKARAAKASTSKAAAAPAAPPSGATAAGAAKPAAKPRKKTTVAPAPVPPPTAAAAAAAEAAANRAAAVAAPVIRRRTKADGVTETTATAAVAAIYSRQPEGEAAEDVQDTEADAAEATAFAHEAAAEVEAQAPAPHESHVSEVSEQEAVQAPEPQVPSEPVSTAAAERGGAVAEPTVSQPPSGPSVQAAPAATSITTGPEKSARSPIVLPPRPVAPRRSILKIVEATPPPQKPMVKPATPVTPGRPAVKPAPGGETKEGFRIVRKENIDQMAEEEAAKKRGGGREQEIKPEDVRFADYRKKERVFLPKKKRLPVGKEIKRTQITTRKAEKRVVEMGETISVQDLANQLSVKATDVIKKLMMMGQMATINQSVDLDTAALIAQEYQYEVRNVAFQEDAFIETAPEDKVEDLQPRPPVVTIMGHVDHGKTSLLDAIREANVAAGEAGGITQHIGAYTVEKNGKLITFIDTPGHEAFSVMRARGANVTDVVVLVVAADDGVMPQTREAISHARAANVPIIVAVNKIDKPGANPEKIKQALSELNLLPEEWGGETLFAEVSALKRTNLDKLLDAILLQAEVVEPKANPAARANGTVLEARLEKGRGPVVSVLVRRGTLRVGDPIVSGIHSGKVKALMDHLGRTVKEVLPGMAAEVLGFEGVPNAGDRFDAPKQDNDAKAIAQNRIDAARAKASVPAAKMSLDDLFSKIQTGTMKELNVVLKADAFGSVEAIRDSLAKLSTEKVKVKVIHSAAGGITESDVLLASASNAIILGFNVRPETKARQVAEAEHVEVMCYSIIYELIDEVKKAMTGLLDKKKVEKFLGRAEVRQTFVVPKVGTIAGSAVIDGKIVRGANVRLLRESRVIFEGKMSSLRRFKDDAKEVASGFECGIGIENYNDVKPGDLIEAFQIELVTPELNA